jgi:protein O-mannosyl-transferase
VRASGPTVPAEATGLLSTRLSKLALFLPGWLAFVFYLPTLEYNFVWDDIYFLVDSPGLRDPALWWQTLRQPLFVSLDYFRPLPLLSFALEAQLTGTTPFIFHLSNILLHALNTTLVVLLARGLNPNRPWLAALAGILFASHPALVESVAWVSDRFDLLMGTFLLSALLAQQRIQRSLLRACALGWLFLAALLCKETSLVFLGLWPVWLVVIAGPDTPLAAHWQRMARAHTLDALALLCAFVTYLFIRYCSLGYLYVGEAQMTPGNSLQHALLIGKTLGGYLSLIVWPFGQVNAAHPSPTPIALNDRQAWLGLGIVTLASLGLIVTLARRLSQHREARPLCLLTLAVIALAPVSNLVPLATADNLQSDRYLLMSLAFIALSISTALAWRSSKKPHPGFVLVTLTWCLVCAITSAQQMPVWRDNLALWQATVARTPDSEVARQNLIAALVTKERYDETIELTRAWLATGSPPASVKYNLVLALTHTGHLDEAETQLRALLAQPYPNTPIKRTSHAESLNLLGVILLDSGRSDEALIALNEAIALAPTLTRPYFNLARANYALGNVHKGDDALSNAISLAHDHSAKMYRQLGAELRSKAVAKGS